MGTSGKADIWGIGDAYEPYVGRWSRVVAREFLPWLGVAPDRRWLDVGCGTGALSQIILEVMSPQEVVGIDRSAGFVAYAQAKVSDPRVRFDVGDGRTLPVQSAAFDAVVSGLVLNFVPEPITMVREMARAARPGGAVGAYVWDYAEGMQFMRRFWDTAVAIDPSARDLDEGRREGSPADPDVLASLFADSGLREVSTRAIDVPTRFRDFDDYWTPFLGGQGPAPSYVMSLEEEHRTSIRERLRATLPIAEDGSIPLTARAWAVHGTR
jgi:SAM-dependent methyltransferase